MPTVSVILPTYNRLGFLREAVESVLHQTYSDWELIVANDGSTDGTEQYLTSLRDQRVRIVPLEHTGSPPKARNAAITTARGHWIAFLDSDDLWHPTKLDVQLQALAKHPECGWGCANVGFIDSKGLPTQQQSGAAYAPFRGWILEALLAATANVPTATLIVRRSLLEELGGLDERLSCRDDIDIALRLAARAEICAVADTLGFVRHHDDRTTSLERVSELFRQNVVVFGKAAAAARAPTIRSAARRRCALERADMARVLSRDGEHGAAMAAIVRAIVENPFAAQIWRGMAGIVIRSAGLGRPAVARS